LRDRITEINYAEEKGRKEGIEKGRKEGIEKGKKEGIEKGKKEGIIQMAKEMLNNGLDIELVSSITKLPKEVLETLK